MGNLGTLVCFEFPKDSPDTHPGWPTGLPGRTMSVHLSHNLHSNYSLHLSHNLHSNYSLHDNSQGPDFTGGPTIEPCYLPNPSTTAEAGCTVTLGHIVILGCIITPAERHLPWRRVKRIPSCSTKAPNYIVIHTCYPSPIESRDNKLQF